MNKNVIISIGRQFGSGGHEIGEKLAERLGIPFYDRNLVTMAADKLHISPGKAEESDEKDMDRFLAYYASTSMHYASMYMNEELFEPISQKVFEAQREIIETLASKGSCIIVGRCADDILRDQPGLINIFITADKKDRIKRIAEKYELSDRKAAERIRKVERERRYYYEKHTGKSWGDISSHQIMLNVSQLGIDKAVDVLEALYKANLGT